MSQNNVYHIEQNSAYSHFVHTKHSVRFNLYNLYNVGIQCFNTYYYMAKYPEIPKIITTINASMPGDIWIFSIQTTNV